MLLRTHVLVLIVLTTILFGWNLGHAPLWDRDEPRNAGCAMEMKSRGDWVVPVFNGELRAHKPALLYWLMISAYSVMGANEFSARISSAILAAGTVFLTYGIAQRMIGQTAALWSAVVLATSLLFTMSARAATPDSSLIFFSTLAIWSFVRLAWRTEQSATPMRWSLPATVAIYTAMGLAVLAKGPVGVVLPVTVLFAFLWLDRNCPWSPKAWSPQALTKVLAEMRPFLGILIVLAVAAPWYLWVGIRTDGVWLREFFGEHNLGRALRPMEGHSGPGIIYYPLSILIGFFPWSILLTPLAIDLWDQYRQQGRTSAAQRLATVWLAVYLLAFSIARTKLPSYLLPAYPAIAIFLGSYLDRRLQGQSRWAGGWFHSGFAVQIIGGIAIVALAGWATQEYFPDSSWLIAIGIIPIALAIVGSWATASHRMVLQSLVLPCTAVLLNFGIFALATSEIGSYQQCDDLFRVIASDPAPGPLVAYGRCEPTWTYYAHRPIRYFPSEQRGELLEYLREVPSATVIMPESDRPSVAELDGNLRSRAEIPYFLRNDRLTVAQWNLQNAASNAETARRR